MSNDHMPLVASHYFFRPLGFSLKKTHGQLNFAHFSVITNSMIYLFIFKEKNGKQILTLNEKSLSQEQMDRILRLDIGKTCELNEKYYRVIGKQDKSAYPEVFGQKEQLYRIDFIVKPI